jgi:hypothetical protein
MPPLEGSAIAPPWHDCERDSQPLQCRAQHTNEGVVLRWADGLVSHLVCEGPCRPYGYLVDPNGGRWKHELFIQGNSAYTQLKTGERIFVPLRPPSPTRTSETPSGSVETAP